MYKPETPNRISNSNTPDDGSSIFAGKPPVLQPHQLSHNYPETTPESLDTTNVSEKVLYATRMLLINNPGLLQEDIAGILDISLYALEQSKQNPNEVQIDDKDKELLLASEMGKLALERQTLWTERSEEEKNKRQVMQLEALKQEERNRRLRQAETIRYRNRIRYTKASLRGEQQRQRQKQVEEHKNLIIEQKRDQIVIIRQAQWFKKLPELKKLLTRQEIEDLSDIHRSNSENEKLQEARPKSVQRRIYILRSKLAIETRAELALWGLHHGVQYPLPEAPQINTLTIRERNVAMHLGLANKEICMKLGLTTKMVHLDVLSLQEKLGVKDRVVLALMAEAYYFQPFEEEILDETPEQLKRFNSYQRPAVQRIYLAATEIAQELKCSEDAVHQNLKKAEKIMGASSRMNLALMLDEEGYSFDIRVPSQQFENLLTKLELECVRLLAKGYSNREIDEELQGLTKSSQSAVTSATKKLRARSRIELALQVVNYDAGETIKEKTRLELLSGRVGEDINSNQELILRLDFAEDRKVITSYQRSAIEAYYAPPEDDLNISWGALCRTHGVQEGRILKLAIRGIENLSKYYVAEKINAVNPNHTPKRKQSLFDDLEMDTKNEDDIEQLLELLDNRQRTLIKEYFLSSYDKSWSEIIKEQDFKLSPSRARMIAKEAIEILQTKLKTGF